MLLPQRQSLAPGPDSLGLTFESSSCPGVLPHGIHSQASLPLPSVLPSPWP